MSSDTELTPFDVPAIAIDPAHDDGAVNSNKHNTHGRAPRDELASSTLHDARRESSAPSVAASRRTIGDKSRISAISSNKGPQRQPKRDEESDSTDSSNSDSEETPDITSGSPDTTSNAEFVLESTSCLSTCQKVVIRTYRMIINRITKGWALMFKAPKRRECFDYDSFYIFTPESKFRIFIFNIVHHKVFEGFIIIVIFMNCVVLALDDPTTDTEPAYQYSLGKFFTATFTLEMLLKMIAYGSMLHEGAYFRSGWNVVDFSIVCLSYLDLLPSFGNFTAFRTLRVLRPLRSMNAIPQLKTIATCLVHSVKGLANVFVLGIFIYFVFSILAVQLWMGNLQYRCVYDYDGAVTSQLCTTSSGGSVVGFTCPDGQSCVATGNPNSGYTSFDSVPWALLVVFQTITLEGWSPLMYLAMDACGWPAAIFFVLIVIIGAYFVLNLCLAVISFHFKNVKDRMLQKDIEAAKNEEMEIRQSEEGLQRARNSLRLPPGAHMADLVAQEEVTLTHRSNVVDVHRVVDLTALPTLGTGDRLHLATQLEQTAAGGILSVLRRDEIYSGNVATLNPASSMSEGHLETNLLKLAEKRPDFGEWDTFVVNLYKIRSVVFSLVEGDLEQNHLESIRKIEVEKLRLLGKSDEAEALILSIPDSGTTPFGIFIYLCIVGNTAVLAAEHFNESDLQSNVANYFNIAFSSLFLLEMVLKLFVLGPYWYVADSFNIFDGGVTIVAIVEITALQGNSTFSVFRAFRMLRVLRLLQGIPSLRALIEVFGLALNESGYLFMVLGLYFLIASLVGMQFFADALQTSGLASDPVISSFVNFPKAFFTVMQILTYDSWPDIMWNAMNATTQGAIAYFIGCIFIGNLCVLNLLVAILIESFETYARKHKKTSIDGSDSDDDEDAGSGVKTGLTVTILSSEPPTIETTLLPKAANDFLTKEINRDDGMAKDLAILQQTKKHMDQNGATESSGHHDDDDSSIDHPISECEEEPTRICEICGDPIVRPFQPISKSIVPITAQELHDRVCEKIQFRKIKERVIKNLLGSMMNLGEEDSEEENEPEGFHKMNRQPNFFKGGDQKYAIWGDFDKGDAFGRVPDPPGVLSPNLFGLAHTPVGSQNPLSTPENQVLDTGPQQALLNLGGKSMKGRRVPTAAAIEDVFGRAWEVGLLLGENVEDYVNAKSWSAIKKLLRTEFSLLQLKIGEEQIGRALIAYTRANVPQQILTNGGYSLNVFGPRNWLRIQLTALVGWAPFDFFILALIICSSITMAMDNPSNSDAFTNILNTIGNSFTVVFCLEAAMKIIAFGFFMIERSYLRDPWNWLDFLVVLISVASWIMESFSSAKLSAFKMMRTLRVLRPLRLINRNRGLKMVVLTLLQSIKGIANMTLILFLVFLVFSILGVQLFGGLLYSCTDPTITLREQCIGNFTSFAAQGGHTGTSVG